jgi:DNA polymerase-4
VAWDRVIAHVDMDAFYASVEIRDDPTLAGRPVAVGGAADRRGVISSASYEARRFGVRSAMPTATARRLCPELLVVPGNMAKYQAASRVLRRIFGEFSPCVEPLSLDEAFLDLTGCDRLLGPPAAVGDRLRGRIREELSLTGSVGISGSKFVAKLASDHRKPDGLTVVPPEEAAAFVQSLPLERLWGAGPSTIETLHRLGIRTIRALAAADPRRLAADLGSSAGRLVELANGIDSRPVVPDAPAKSLSHETTFARDVADVGVLEGVLLGLAEGVARRARRGGVSGRTVHLKVRRPDFTTWTRSRTLASPTREAATIFRAARELFHALDRGGAPVRLIGVGISGLTDAPQLELELFPAAKPETAAGPERLGRLEEAEDAIVTRFGRGALARARTLLAAGTEDTSSLAGRPRLED